MDLNVLAQRRKIAERREAIVSASPCEGCGATLALCKSQRGKDPTAPDWFGCCARGTGMLACRHVPDSQELLRLLKEIESGEVAPVPDPDDELLASIEEFPLLSPSRRGRSLRRRVMAMAGDSWPDDVPM